MLELSSTEPAVSCARSATAGNGEQRDYVHYLQACVFTEPAMLAIETLTAQQHRVFHHLSEGLTNKQIARRLGLHESTIKVHVSAILAKLDCPNRTAAALLAMYHRLQPFLINDGANPVP